MSSRGEQVVELAQQEWNLPVVTGKNPGEDRILDYIKGPSALNWTWDDRSGFNWCGGFAAAVYPNVKVGIRREHFASTYRLDEWAKGTARAIPVRPEDVEPGDIILVGPARDYVSSNGIRKRHGRHIAIVESVNADDRSVNTIEGNTRGVQPDGGKQHGVGKDVRVFPDHPSVKSGKDWRIVAVVRPIEEDYKNPQSKISKLISSIMSAGTLVGLGGFGLLSAGLYYYIRK